MAHGGKMKKNTKCLVFLGAIMALAFVAGCSENKSVASIEAMVASDTAFQAAVEQQNKGDLVGARDSFKKIVVAQPTNSLARLHYAILLQDVPPSDPYAALSNFEAYLELAPNSEKRNLVEERIQIARKQISNRFDETLIEDHQKKIGTLDNLVREKNNVIANLEKELDLSKRLIAQLETARNTEITRNKRLNSIIDTLSTGRAFATEVNPPNINRTYKVQPGDTLMKIARKLYDDPNRAVDIRAANGISEDDSLKVGTELIIP